MATQLEQIGRGLIEHGVVGFQDGAHLFQFAGAWMFSKDLEDGCLGLRFLRMDSPV